jgi:hypothetical protein
VELRNTARTIKELSLNSLHIRIWNFWTSKACSFQRQALSLCFENNAKKINIITESAYALALLKISFAKC